MHVPVLKQYWHHFWMQCHDNMVVKSMAEKHGSQHVSRNGFSNHDMHQHDLYQLLLFTLHPIEVKVSLSWCMNAAGTICDNWCPGSLKKICPLRRTLGWTGWQHEKPPFHQQTSDTEMICWHPKNTHRDSWWFKTSDKKLYNRQVVRVGHNKVFWSERTAVQSFYIGGDASGHPHSY